MYGRETPVGYQKSIDTGSVSPACWSSCFALFGSYGYFTTLGDQPNSCGGWNCGATWPRPPENAFTTVCPARPYAIAFRTRRLFVGAFDRFMPTYATLNDGRLSPFSEELLLTVGTSCGWSRSMPLISPVCSACTRAVLSAIGRMTICASFTFLPQYRAFLFRMTSSLTVHPPNLYGPVPVGCENAYDPVGRNAPFEIVPESESYCVSAFGDCIAKDWSASDGINGPLRFASVMTAVFAFFTLQLR